jgi:hypothetical protein
MPVHWDGSMISPAENFDGAPVLRKDIALQTGQGDLRSAELHVSLGNGWFRGRLTWSGARALYADRLGVIGQLEMGYADGHRQVLVSDETWTAGPSAVLANDLYDGQTIDARRFDDTWARLGAAPAGWVDVETLEFDTGLLTPYIGPPVTGRRRAAGGRPHFAVEAHAGGLRPEPRGLAAVPGARTRGSRDHRPPRRGAGGRLARRAPAARHGVDPGLERRCPSGCPGRCGGLR